MLNAHTTRRRIPIPPLLTDIVQSSILLFDGMVFDTLDACHGCGGSLSGYDLRPRQFAVMIRDGARYPVRVSVKRFSCRRCGRICTADGPFHEGTRHGAPIVDLCRALAQEMPFHRAASFLEKMGFLVERGTVRNYACRVFPGISTTEIFGIRIPLSIVSLSELALRTTGNEGITAREALTACGLPPGSRAGVQPKYAPG